MTFYVALVGAQGCLGWQVALSRKPEEVGSMRSLTPDVPMSQERKFKVWTNQYCSSEVIITVMQLYTEMGTMLHEAFSERKYSVLPPSVCPGLGRGEGGGI